MAAVARAVGVTAALVRRWQRLGWLEANQDADGLWRVRRRAWARALQDPRVALSIAESRVRRQRAEARKRGPAPGGPTS